MSIVNFSSRKRLLKAKKPNPPLRTLNTEFEKTSFPDLITELSRNAHLYSLDSKSLQTDWITIYHLPVSVINLHSFIKSKIQKDHPPGLRPFLCLCLTHGIDIFKSNEGVHELMLCYDRLYRYEETGEAGECFIIDYLKTPIQLVNTERGKRVNIPVTEWVKQNLSELCEQLGSDLSTMAVMCLYSYLLTQDVHIPAKKLESWSTILADYLSVVNVKAAGAVALTQSYYGY